MATWQQVKATGHASDRLNVALRALGEHHCEMLGGTRDTELSALADEIEALVLRLDSTELTVSEPEEPLPYAI